MEKNLLRLNLQLFADDELGENDFDNGNSDAEQSEYEGGNDADSEGAESTPAEDPEESKDFKNETNAAYANMRRKAEAQAQARFDSEIAQLCEGYVHPITQKPITSLAEYKDALYQQERLAAEEQLKESGLDASAIDNLIANNPVIKQAQAVIAQSQQVEAERRLQSDFEIVKTLDPSIKTMNDIPNLNYIANVLQSNPYMSLVDAYKLVNFDTLMNNAKAGAKQGAINQIKGKSHLTGVDSLSNESDEIEIPQAELRSLKEAFPSKTDAELKKLYNKTLKKLKGE